MALKEDVEVARIETVKAVREEVEPMRQQMDAIGGQVSQAFSVTKLLHERVCERRVIKNAKNNASAGAAVNVHRAQTV